MTFRFKELRRMTTRTRIAAAAFGLSLIAGQAMAQAGFTFSETTGKEIYEGICQGCHMPDGKGSQGAGSAPLLQRLLAGGPFQGLQQRIAFDEHGSTERQAWFVQVREGRFQTIGHVYGQRAIAGFADDFELLTSQHAAKYGAHHVVLE